MNETVRQSILALRRESGVAYVASVDGEGYPQIKAMLVPEHASCRTQYFSTNTSSKRAGQFRQNPKASVYYCDPAGFRGALFTGEIEVLTDHGSKAALWQEGDERYYPKGVDDEDYCVYRFTAGTVNYYHALGNATFPVAELEQD